MCGIDISLTVDPRNVNLVRFPAPGRGNYAGVRRDTRLMDELKMLQSIRWCRREKLEHTFSPSIAELIK